MQINKPRILCVDDEPMVLEGLELHLQRHFKVKTAESGSAALDILREGDRYAVLLSDMRMPGMSGAELLREARLLVPDTVRILLTGHADLDSALAAINQGGIFRFLCKPCPAQIVVQSVSEAAEHHRLVHAEKELLEQTLTGSVRTLTEILALASPVAFGRAARMEARVNALCDQFEVKNRWAVSLATQLFHLGFITLPPSAAEKLYYGLDLTPAEQEMVDRVPSLSDQFLAHIPRLEPVREIIRTLGRSVDAPRTSAAAGASLAGHILRAVMDLDTAEASGLGTEAALHTLAQRPGAYDGAVLEALAWIAGKTIRAARSRELPISALTPGMVLAEDVRLKTGTLLIARQHKVSQSLVERLKNMPPGVIREPIRVFAAEGDA